MRVFIPGGAPCRGKRKRSYAEVFKVQLLCSKKLKAGTVCQPHSTAPQTNVAERGNIQRDGFQRA